MMGRNAIELARWQLERDRARAARFPGVLERKIARMTASPLAFLRGAAPLFYRVLSEEPELASGPDGDGWLCGDAHLENFGAYRTERQRAGDADDEPVVFDVNDFDETIRGPWRLDVLRLVTSLILGGQELGTDGRQSLALSARLLDAYVRITSGDPPEPSPPDSVARLLAKVGRRSHRDMLSDRTLVANGRRTFVLGSRYAALPPALATTAREAFAAYARTVDEALVPRERLEVEDVAFRIAGTGSLGGLRVAVLTRGKGAPDATWLFDMKETAEPAASLLLGESALPSDERVLSGMRACLERPPRMLGRTLLDGLPMLVRRLSPQEDKLNLTRLAPEDLPPLAGHLGMLLGRAHLRGADRKPSEPWSGAARSTLIDRAVILAGIHEAAYLALCKLS